MSWKKWGLTWTPWRKSQGLTETEDHLQSQLRDVYGRRVNINGLMRDDIRSWRDD